MATSVRFYDHDIVDGSGNYNDGSVATGAVGKGRFVLTVDPFTAPSGTDGQFDEFDFVVDDPGDSTMVFWGFVGVNVAASPALVDVGFTFDAATPTTFDYWACYRTTKAAYDSFVAANLVAGATNYARNNATFYDGTYHIQGLGFDVPVDGASVADWWTDAPPPATSDTPVITAPTSGSSYTPADDLVVTVTWTETDEVSFEVEVVGAIAEGVGFEPSSGHSVDLTFRYPQTGSVTIRVRATQTGKTVSAWAEVPITITADVDTPVSCVEAEMLLDTPLRLWIPRHTVGWYVDDFSPANDYLYMRQTVDHAGGGGGGGQDGGQNLINQNDFTISVPSGPSLPIIRGVLVAVWGLHHSGGSPNIVPPAGWAIIDQRYAAYNGSYEQSWHILKLDNAGSSSFNADFHFDTNETHDFSWFMEAYTDLDLTPIAIGSATAGVGTADLTLADLDGAVGVNPADSGLVWALIGGTNFADGTPVGWSSVGPETYNDAQRFTKDPWTERMGSSITVHRTTATLTWFGVNLILRSTVDELVEETSGICDRACTDVNYALIDAGRLIPSEALRLSLDQVLVGLTAWTVVLIAGIQADYHRGVDSADTDVIFTDNGSVASQIGIEPGTPDQIIAQVQGSLGFVGLGGSDTRVKKAGCSTMVAVTYDQSAALDKVRVFVGDHLHATSATDPGPVAAFSGIPLNITSGPKGNWSLFAMFDQALTRKRLAA